MNACCNCGKRIRKMIRLYRDNKEISASFCSYDCYLDFWGNVSGFVPLPQTKPVPPKPTPKEPRIIILKYFQGGKKNGTRKE